MKTITVGMGDLQVTTDPDSMLITHALGSCIAVMVHDPVRQVGGMIHYMLPLSSITPEKGIERPAMFADTGVPLLFHRMYDCSCKKSDLVVRVVGGASIHDEMGTFEIGKRNYVVLRKLFWKSGVAIAAEEVGGGVSRTVRLFVGDGRTTVRASDRAEELVL
jgi:chemotaxis protein CheD